MPTRDPFAEIEQFFDRMSRQFDAGDFGSVAGFGSVSVDLGDTDDEYVLVADLPGFDKADIDVTIDEQTVRIRAERESSTDIEEDEYVHRERSHRQVDRRVRLPGPVEEDDAAATYENGVLTVRLPKESPATDGDEGHSIDID